MFFRSQFSLNKAELNEQEVLKKMGSMPRAVLSQNIKKNLEEVVGSPTFTLDDEKRSTFTNSISFDFKASEFSKSLREDTIEI